MATVGSEKTGAAQARDVFVALAQLDEVGEHKLEADPAQADAILVVNLQQHPHDPFLKILRADELVRKYADKLFVYDERDRPFFTFPGIYVAGTPRSASRRAIVGGPYPNLPNALQPTGQEPDLLYSFQGGRTHPVRDAVLSLRHPRGIVKDTSGLDFFDWSRTSDNTRLHDGRARYASSITRTKFVLCPRGHGPSSFRLYETMSAGRVPVVISDSWLAPPRVAWDECIVRVAEQDVRHLPRILEAVEDRWPDMVRAGRTAHAEHFAPARLWHHYATSIAQIQSSPHAFIPWWAQAQVLRIFVRRTRGHVRASLKRAGGSSMAG